MLSRHQNAGKNWDITIANRSFENMSQFKCLETTVKKSEFGTEGN
jgi:hypothetical protein